MSIADLDMRDHLRIHPSRVKKVELIEKKPAAKPEGAKARPILKFVEG